MGKKRGEQGKHLFLHCACLLAFLLSFTGCAAISNFEKQWQGRRQLESAESFLYQKDFEKALKAYAQVADAFPDSSPGAGAVFHMGLIWAHPENPERDVKKARRYFQRLIRDFPEDVFDGEKWVLFSVVDELVQSRDRIKNQEETIEFLLSGVDELVQCRHRLKSREEAIEMLKNQLKEMKKIDIGIEEKKRKNLLDE